MNERRPALRLVPRRAEPQAVVQLDRARTEAQAQRVIRAEARALEAECGKNAYSDFLLKHGCRPDPAQADTIGRLFGVQVKASDGTMRPKLTKAERKAARAARATQKQEERIKAQVWRVKNALTCLTAENFDPEEICAHTCPHFDAPEIGERLDSAINWLVRFAEVWRSHGDGTQ